jgi:TonB family protein
VLHLLAETGLYRPNPKSSLYSIAIHAAVILLLFAFASTQTIPVAFRPPTRLTDPLLAPLTLPSHAGGGGGTGMPLPASKGVLPPRSNRQFVPPEAVLTNLNPRLTIQPTIIAPPDATVPQVGLYGDPLGRLGIPSNGPGSGWGIGSGRDGGDGPGKGPSAGPGECCDVGVFSSGGGVTAPTVIDQVEPQYSEEARKAKISGVVILDLVVDPSGHARNIHVTHGAGMGLDEKAIEAVQQWRFKPGTKGGKPVPVHARVDVNFRLL